MKTGSGERGSVMAEINMVPLIDIALVVLIIFMVMSPMLVRMQLKVDPPSAQSSESTPDTKDLLEIGVEANGTIHVGGRVVAEVDLEETLRRILIAPETQPVYVMADKTTPFQNVVTVMDAAKKAGAVKLGVGTRGNDPAGRKRE